MVGGNADKANGKEDRICMDMHVTRRGRCRGKRKRVRVHLQRYISGLPCSVILHVQIGVEIGIPSTLVGSTGIENVSGLGYDKEQGSVYMIRKNT